MARARQFDYAEIAGLVAAAQALDVPAAPHVAKVLGTDARTAQNAIGSARRAGYVIPHTHTVPKRRRGTSDGLRLRCATCPRNYPVDGLLDLMKHTRREHARTVTHEEKKPR